MAQGRVTAYIPTIDSPLLASKQASNSMSAEKLRVLPFGKRLIHDGGELLQRCSVRLRTVGLPSSQQASMPASRRPQKRFTTKKHNRQPPCNANTEYKLLAKWRCLHLRGTTQQSLSSSPVRYHLLRPRKAAAGRFTLLRPFFSAPLLRRQISTL